MELINKSLNIIAATMALGTSIAFAAPGEPYTEEWVEGRVHGALSYNKYLDSTDIEVDNNKGAITLSGKVSSDTERDLAEQVASSMEGVSSVSNKIEVDLDLAPRSRPAWLQKNIDATTTAAVKSRLMANKDMHDMNIHIVTRDGIVALSGTVSSLAQEEKAKEITYNTRDVMDVKSELKIADASTLSEKANNASVNVSRAVSDTWISSKIRSSLIFNSDFPGSSINVSTTNGKVTLEGFARNPAQRNEIEKTINDFYGVREVQNNLKVRS